MPLYEYRCRDCGHRFEVLQRLGAGGEDLSCPRCRASAPNRVFSTFAAVAGRAESLTSCAPQGCGAPECATGFT